MQGVTLTMLYHEIQSIKEELQKLERLILPEIKLPPAELTELKKLRQDALKELTEGKLVPASEL